MGGSKAGRCCSGATFVFPVRKTRKIPCLHCRWTIHETTTLFPDLVRGRHHLEKVFKWRRCSIMVSLQEDEPSEHVSEHTREEPSSSNNKRPNLNEDNGPPSTKRLKTSKGTTEIQRKPEKQRNSGTKTKQTGSDNSGKPRWSVVASPSSRNSFEQGQTIVRPRLWSSSREELGSTFTEISVSKCVNNVSWTSTDMPILILDNEFISLDNSGVESRLCVDITFVRQFICAASDMQPQKFPGTMDQKQEDIPYEIHPSCPQPVEPEQLAPHSGFQECEAQTQDAQPVSKEQPSPGPSTTPALLESLPAPVTTEDPPPKPLVVRIPKSKSKKAQPRQGRKSRSGPLPKKSPSPAPRLRVSQEPAQAKKATGALSSLRFKKNKPAATDNPLTSKTLHQSPLPTPSPTSDLPQHLGASAPTTSQASVFPPSEQAQTDGSCHLPSPHLPEPTVLSALQSPIAPSEHPVSHSSQPSHPLSHRHFASEVAAPELKPVINGQTDFGPTSQYYPDERFLPPSDNYPHTLTWDLDAPASTSSTHHPVKEFKDGKFGLAANKTSAVPQCRCSRFRYHRQCQICQPSAEPRPRTPLPKQNSVHCDSQGNSGAGPSVRLLGVPTAPRAMMLEGPNKIIIGKRRAWGTSQVHSDVKPTIPVQNPTGPRSPPEDQSRLSTQLETDSALSAKTQFPISPKSSFPEVVATPNTTRRATDRESVAISASSSLKPLNKHSTILQTPGITGEIQASNDSIPTPGSVASTQMPTPPTTADIANGRPLSTGFTSPPPCEQTVTTVGTTISTSLKRKGKERYQEPETSGEEPLSVGVERWRIAKKAKRKHEHAVDSYHESFARGDGPTRPMACSSKVKLEDFSVPKVNRRVPKNRVKPVDTSGPGVEEPPLVPPKSPPTKPVKRRGRPPKNAKPTPCVTPQPLTHDLSMQVDSAVSESAPQTQPELPLTLSISAIKPKSRASKPKSQKPPPAPIGPIPRRENGVPICIPDEIQALVDAYINGLPVGIFAARRHMEDFWRLKLPQDEEIGYAFMGFYRISRVWECLVEEESDVGGGNEVAQSRGKQAVEEGNAKVRVQWKFRMWWEPGGEDSQTSKRDKLSSPWWGPTLEPRGLSFVPQPDLEDSDNESTMVYRTARRENPNFTRRHCFFNQAFFSVLPLHLLAPVLAEVPDSAFPRGWLCEDCGKLNFRYHLRHRRCSSSYCKDKPEMEGYAVSVDRLRDPQDALPSSLPLNELPNNVPCEAKIQTWKDRTKTLIYTLGVAGNESAGLATIRHIFMCNLKDLQTEATELLNVVQKEVPVRRVLTETNPYFVYCAGDGDGGDGKFVPWGSAPKCLQRAQELMNSRGRKYGKKSVAELNIQQVVVRAWVTPGNKRGSDLLCAKRRCIVIMCLGCEVIISISPKSVMASNGDQARVPDLDKLIPMESFDPQDVKFDITPLLNPEIGVKVETDTTLMDTGDQIYSALAVLTKGGVEAKKTEKAVLSVSLLHGDMLLLEGDDFEYTIKRTGTSVLLFGS